MGVYFLEFSYKNEKLDYITVEGNTYTHKQVEFKDGLVFMRMKKRLMKK